MASLQDNQPFESEYGVVRIPHSHFPNVFLSISNFGGDGMETYPGMYTDDTHTQVEWLGNYSRRIGGQNAKGLRHHLKMFEAGIWKFWMYEHTNAFKEVE